MSNVDKLIQNFQTQYAVTFPLDESSDVRIRLEHNTIYQCATFTILLPESYDYEQSLPIVESVFADFDSNAYKINAKMIKFEVFKENMDFSFHCILPKRLGWIMSYDYPTAFYGTFTARVTCSNYSQKYIEVETMMTMAELKNQLNQQHLNPSRLYATTLRRNHLILSDTMRIENLYSSDCDTVPLELTCDVKVLTS
jgi:hypothetical protein